MSKKTGFTLIELLIVVAIIAILAAIAVPNFLEAQTRAKVARVVSDQRSMAVAIEAYTVDNRKPPREYSTDAPPVGYSDYDFSTNGSGVGGIVATSLSTPIAYMTNAWLQDAFVEKGSAIAKDEQVFSYHNQLVRRDVAGKRLYGSSNETLAKELHVNFYGAWRIISIGPDRTYFNTFAGNSRPFELSENLLYDASNGTISLGNVIRSQAQADKSMPRVTPGLLGAH